MKCPHCGEKLNIRNKHRWGYSIAECPFNPNKQRVI